MIGTNSLSRGSNFLHFSITEKKNVLSSRLLWDIICMIYQIIFFLLNLLFWINLLFELSLCGNNHVGRVYKYLFATTFLS